MADKRKKKSQTGLYIVLVVMLLCVLGILFTVIGGDDDNKKSSTSSERVTLVCDDCAEIGMEINIWKTPRRAGVAGSVPSGTRATVLDKETYNGVLHYKISASGITGWVSRQMVQK